MDLVGQVVQSTMFQVTVTRRLGFDPNLADTSVTNVVCLVTKGILVSSAISEPTTLTEVKVSSALA